MNEQLYNDVEFWLNGDITNEERRWIIEALFTGDEQEVRKQLDIISWNHLGMD